MATAGANHERWCFFSTCLFGPTMDNRLFKLSWMILICLLFGILNGHKIGGGKRRRCKSIFWTTREWEHQKKTWYNLQVSKEFSKIATKRRQMFYLSVLNRFQRFVVKEASHKSISRIQVRVSGRIFIKTFYNLGTRYFVPINNQNLHQSQLFSLYHVSLLPIY